MDFCGDFVNACLPHIISLLYKALGQRVTLIAAKPLPNATVIFGCSLWFMLNWTGVTSGEAGSNKSKPFGFAEQFLHDRCTSCCPKH